MYAIAPTINPDDSGDQVANLQAALLFLLDQDVTLFFDPLKTPTADQLKAITQALLAEASAKLFDKTTRALTSAFQQRQGLSPQLKGVVDQTTADALNARLRKFGALAGDNTFSVEGRVIDEQGRGLPGLQVMLFEQDVTGPTQLGAAMRTSSEGVYIFNFNQSEYLDGDFGELPQPGIRMLDRLMTHLPSTPGALKVLSGPDLWVGLGSNSEAIGARTEIVFNAGHHLVMPDLVVSRDVLSAGLCDLERVIGLVGPRLKDLSLHALTDAQIDFLARDCEEPPALIKALVIASRSEYQAEKLAGDFGIARPDGVALGILALQFTAAADDGSSSLERLLVLHDDAIRGSLKDGIARARIPAGAGDVLEVFVKWMAELRAQYRLSDHADGARATPGQMLATLPDPLRLKGELLLGVARALDHWNSDPERFIAGVRDAGLDETQVHAVARTLSLGDLTGAHLPLIALLQTTAPGPGHAALIDLAVLGRNDWVELVKKAGLPAETEKGPASFDTYVTTLIRGLELRAPTAFVMSRVNDGRIPFEPKLLEPAQRFMDNSPAFRFGSDSVFARFGNDGATDGVDDTSVQPLLQELLKVERIARVAPSLETAEYVLAGGYQSALSITQRRAADFIAEMKDTLPGGEAEARQVHERARGVAETAFALALTASPRFNREGEIELLSGSSPATGHEATAPSSASSAQTAARQAQTANLEVLFGGQDACACDPCSAMGGPAHYLTELLMLLGRSGRNAAQKSPLDLLLERRPDIEEIELDCDNSGHVMPHVDLLLEMLESALFKDKPRTWIPRIAGDEAVLDRGELPPGFAIRMLDAAGLDFGSKVIVRRVNPDPPSGPPNDQIWSLRGNGWRLRMRIHGSLSSYKYALYPQSLQARTPESWAFPVQLMTAAYAPLADARYPWSLPFDLARVETDGWLRLLGTSLRAVSELCMAPAGPSDLHAATAVLGFATGDVQIVREDVAAAANGLDWGYPAGQLWVKELERVSEFRTRAGISHLELLALLQCRFIQRSPGIGAGERLVLSGDECDGSKMFVGETPAAIGSGRAILTPAVLRRVFLLVRLARRTGWSLLDLDRAINAQGSPTQTFTVGGSEVLTQDLLLFLADLARLTEQTAMLPEFAVALFRPLLDTHTYWRQEGSRAIEIPSTFDRLFRNPSVSRPHTPDFELDLTREALLRTPKAGQIPQLRLSDQVSVIAAAAGCTAADVLALLPRGETIIAVIASGTTSVDGVIELPAAGSVVIECAAGLLSPNHTFEVRFQAAGPNGNFADAPASHFSLNGNAISLPVVWTHPPTLGWRVDRYTYNPPVGQRAKRLRVRAQFLSGSVAMWFSARILTGPGLVPDDLTLSALSTLTRHLLLARACKLDGSDYRRMLEISGAQPLAGPSEALNFLEQVRRLRDLGLTAMDLDGLLRERFADAQGFQRAQIQVCETLKALREELAIEERDLTVEPGQAEASLRKALLEAGWPQRLVDAVVSIETLGRVFQTEHQAELGELPEAIRISLPSELTYRSDTGRLHWSSGHLGALDAFKEARKKLHEQLQQLGDVDLTREVDKAMGILDDAIATEDKAIASAANRLNLLAQSFELPVFESPVSGAAVAAMRALVVPPAWADSLWFDAGRLCLCFKGPMSGVWRDEIMRFSQADAYVRAINGLFAKATAYREPEFTSIFLPPDRNRNGAYQLLAGVAPGLEQRSLALLGRVIAMVRVRRATKRALTVLEPRLGAAAGVASAMVDRYRHLAGNSALPLVGAGVSYGVLLDPGFARSALSVEITPSGFEPQYNAIRRLFKLATLAKASKLDETEVAWLMGAWPVQRVMRLDALPSSEQVGPAQAWADWKQWTTVLDARQQAGGAGALTGCIEGLISADTLVAIGRKLERWSAVPADEVTALLRGLGVASLDELRSPGRVRQLVACLDWMRTTGCDAASLVAWGTLPPSLPATARARQFARAKVGDAAWPEASRQPLDTLRIKRRGALVTEAVHRLGLRDANDLFGRLLVDPEMGPCMQTTRIRLAISSVQLFVQRILLGLEQAGTPTASHVSPGAIDSREWDWMQNYRMWEANLKVLLNSENYIDMSLRRDKTPPYRAVEVDLIQGEVSGARATAALTSYLEQLSQVSRLQTVGMYRDTPRDANGARTWEPETLYFVGASRNSPRQHYLRSLVSQTSGHATWTPWESIDLDLQDTACVTPVVLARELWLFWLSFREEAAQPVLSSNAAKGSLPSKHWAIDLRWSKQQSGKWTSPKVYAFRDYMPMSGFKTEDFVLRAVQGNSGESVTLRLVGGRSSFSPRDVLELAVGDHDLKLSSSLSAPIFLPSSPFERPLVRQDSALPRLTLSVRTLNDLAVFLTTGSTNRLQLAFAHQDIASAGKFCAPMPALAAMLDAAFGTGLSHDSSHHFVIDAGEGELLVQPRWDEVQLPPSSSTLVLYTNTISRLAFTTAHHPHIGLFRRALLDKGLAAFFTPQTQEPPNDPSNWFTRLGPDPVTVPQECYPYLGVDFAPAGSYSTYNTELFFMIPFAVACELSKQQRFREAREWFHYVFNPTTTATTPSIGPGRYWNYLPFQREQGTAPIQALVRKLADPADQSTEKRDFLAAIAQWRVDPFDPHVVARLRPASYQKAMVIAYIKNFIAWGDQLFRRDTMEALNEAAQFYVLAAQILGRPGEIIPPRTRPVLKAFTELREDLAVSGTAGVSNPLVAAENVLPLAYAASGTNSSGNLPQTLYFCVPDNPVFKELRQTVQDRLFKIRNCMNIDGVVRQLALFEPPIDPAALVRARAAGVDVSSLMSDLATPPPIYRFAVFAQKASEVCGEVKSLGAALLAALEKADGEALTRLRSGHELRVLANVRQMKELQIEEAKASIEALGPTLEGAQARMAYYVGLVTQVEDMAIPTGPAGPTIKALAVAALQTFTNTLSVVQAVTAHINPIGAAATALLKAALTRATDAIAGTGVSDDAATAKVPMNMAEKSQLQEMQSAREAQGKANSLRLVAQLLAKIPDFKLGASGIASPVVTAELGGSLLSSVANFDASIQDARAAEHSHRATLNSMLGSYQRRAAEWTQQAKNASAEIEQINRQITAAGIRAAIAAQDLRNHDEQIANAAEVDEFMRTKWSNQELYSWMSQQISSVYFRSFQLAYELAKRAERAYRHELGVESSGFVRSGHWDGLKSGLLAGELLFHDIKRMEFAYLDANARELEITRSISLRQLDTDALMELRIDGQCGFELPEWLFNMDYPDHYQRRIKSVSVSLPCVVGPYTGVSGKLTMLTGKVRSGPTPGSIYDDDASYRSSNFAASSVAISSAHGDSGLFEFNLRDERFLPFEGAGLVGSRWRFELPRHVRQFDYETVSDLVLTVRYTARSSTALKQPAIDDLNMRLAGNPVRPLLVDVKRDFPAAWTQAAGAPGTGPTHLSFVLERHHLPYAWARRASIAADARYSAWVKGSATQAWRRSTARVRATARPDGESWALEISELQPAASWNQVDEALLSFGYSVGVS